jgi:hypothetical protein
MIELLIVAQLGCGIQNYNTPECQNQRLIQEQTRAAERRHQELMLQQQPRTQGPLFPRLGGPFCDYAQGNCR